MLIVRATAVIKPTAMPIIRPRLLHNLLVARIKMERTLWTMRMGDVPPRMGYGPMIICPSVSPLRISTLSSVFDADLDDHPALDLAVLNQDEIAALEGAHCRRRKPQHVVLLLQNDGDAYQCALLQSDVRILPG